MSFLQLSHESDLFALRESGCIKKEFVTSKGGSLTLEYFLSEARQHYIKFLTLYDIIAYVITNCRR